MCAVALSTISNGQVSFIQNHMNGVKVGDFRYTLTDSTITFEAVDNKLIKQFEKLGESPMQTDKAKLVTINKRGEKTEYVYNMSYVDELGFEVRKVMRIFQNYDNKGGWMTSVKQFNTFDNIVNEVTTLNL